MKIITFEILRFDMKVGVGLRSLSMVGVGLRSLDTKYTVALLSFRLKTTISMRTALFMTNLKKTELSTLM